MRRGAQPVPYLPLHTPIYSRRQPTARSKRGATFLLSFRLPPFFLSPSLERCSRAGPSRARGIKYNKDIQWELIGYLPIYRSLSAYCCVVPLVQRQCTEPLPCRSVRTRLVSSSILRPSLLFLRFALFSFTACADRAQIKIFRGGIISRIAHVFSGRNTSISLRRVRVESSNVGIFFYRAHGECA